LIARLPSALYSRTIVPGGAAEVFERGAGAGNEASSPVCVSGNAARKMMSRTSRTSMRGVTLMSAWCLIA
jgi:hypothetical protein